MLSSSEDISIHLMEAKELLQQHIAKIASLTEEEFNYLFSHFKPLFFKKGQTIISEGDKVDCEYFVIS